MGQKNLFLFYVHVIVHKLVFRRILKWLSIKLKGDVKNLI